MKVTNLTVWAAVGPINALGQVKLPVRASMAVAKLGIQLAEARKPIEKVRQDLVEKHSKKDEAGKPVKLENGNIVLADADAFTREFNELMDAECDVEFPGDKDKVKLPEKVSATCDKCHHNMDRPFEIESAILSALMSFVEVP